MIDTHCHLNDADAFPDPAAEIQFARSCGVDRLLVVGVEPPDWRRALDLADRFDEVFAILGWHPNYTADFDGVSALRDSLSHPRVVALGEIGLDFYWDRSPRDVQYRALRQQLELAAEMSLPMVFHARDATSPLLDILEERGPGRYLLHCFAGDTEDARRAVALGCYLGVDGPVTYKKNDAYRDLLARLPADRLVVETDAPYLTPAPFRGKPNRPGYVRYVSDALSHLLGLDPAAGALRFQRNAEAFFGLP